MDRQPSEKDIEAVFHRLRAIPANKTCFDCNAKNPTWSSVTYGVFICIDCSAVHRNLGVHLTFVRSTQLDTNWTWLQLRQMQLGGNANALQFFLQHNCSTTDAQKKYNSRAAQLYRDKLQQLALKSLENNNQLNLNEGAFFTHNIKLHVDAHVEEKPEEKEEDFFEAHENFAIPENPVQETKIENVTLSTIASDVNPGEGPKVDLTSNSQSEPRKSTIGARKTPAKKTLGAKKGGLGATRVKTNFADLEKEAAMAEESRLRAREDAARAAALTAQEQEEREAAVRLAYKDISNQQQKKEEQMRRTDPKKADQVERLGMGMNNVRSGGISHSALSDMKTIEQENVQSTTTSLNSIGKLRISDSDSFFDDYSYGSGFSMNRNTNPSPFGSSARSDGAESGGRSSKDQWVIVDDPSADSPRNPPRKEKIPITATGAGDEAQKKFGSAKAISSDQFFNDGRSDHEVQANLSRFQGSSSISSSDFFGNKDNTATSSSRPLQNIDLEDVKDSVRYGVTRVAERFSSIANGVMSSLQERYGY